MRLQTGAALCWKLDVQVTIAYALPDVQHVAELDVEPGTTAAEALQLALRRQLLGDAVQADVAMGVFGEVVPPDYALQAGDRLELYRPLLVDPKEARRLRAVRDS